MIWFGQDDKPPTSSGWGKNLEGHNVRIPSHKLAQGAQGKVGPWANFGGRKLYVGAMEKLRGARVAYLGLEKLIESHLRRGAVRIISRDTTQNLPPNQPIRRIRFRWGYKKNNWVSLFGLAYNQNGQ